jgi:transposase InsO family protein
MRQPIHPMRVGRHCRLHITSPGRACHEPLEHKSVHERPVLKLALDDGTSDGVWLGTEGPGVRASCVHAHAAPMRAEPGSYGVNKPERLGTRRRVDDRDGIFAPAVDEALCSMSLQVLRTPIRAPQANAYCERLIGTVRRECLDWVIPLNERHLRRTLAEWIPHYNRERPHSALGPGLPHQPPAPTILTGHQLPPTHRVVARARLGGLHHHQLEPIAA